MNGDESGFKRYIVFFVILSAFTGAIGSVQRLCFRLAGVRMAIGARNKLFRGVISQVLLLLLLLFPLLLLESGAVCVLKSVPYTKC